MTEPIQYYICRILYLTFKTLVHDSDCAVNFLPSFSLFVTVYQCSIISAWCIQGRGLISNTLRWVWGKSALYCLYTATGFDVMSCAYRKVFQ